MKDYKSMDKRKNVLGMVWVNLIRKFGGKKRQILTVLHIPA